MSLLDKGNEKENLKELADKSGKDGLLGIGIGKFSIVSGDLIQVHEIETVWHKEGAQFSW
jgi:hypothetical protein